MTEPPGLSPRKTGDLKRVATPHKDTVWLLAEPHQPCYARYLAERDDHPDVAAVSVRLA
jgi:hypothetical protein